MPGMCYLIESDLEDVTNQNSCVITYYEIGPASNDVNDLEKELTNSIMMSVLKEPFFNELRTKQ